MLKKVLLLVLVAAPLAMFAQVKAEKLGYVDYQAIFMKMPQLKQVETTLEAKSEAIKKNAAAIEAEYNSKVKAFQNTPTDSITQSIAMDRQKELQQLQQRYQDFMQSSQAEYEKQQKDLIAPVHQKLHDVIKQVADEGGFTYVFDAGSLLYFSPNAIDISKQVKAKLNILN